jgi:nitrogen regulatory protein PII
MIRFFKIHQVEAVIDKIIEMARTGEIGDGKIFCKCTALLVTSSSHATSVIFILVQGFLLRNYFISFLPATS